MVGGVLFATWQVRATGRQRRDLAAVELVRTIQTPEFQEAMETVMYLPDDLDPEQVDAQPELKNASEWNEWLALQLERQPAPGKSLGAHVAHRDWRP